MTSRPTVSIVIPTFNEERYINRVLDACLAQTYPRELIEVVIADGRSTDSTRERIVQREEDFNAITLVDNDDRHQSHGLNIGIAASHGKVVVRWDAHAEYDVRYVEQAVDALQRYGSDVVGCAWEPIGEGRFGSWVAAAMKSRIGVGNDRFRSGGRARVVDTVNGVVMTRETFDSTGGYDTSMRPAGEDADLTYRIRQAGGSIMLDPAIKALYYTRESPTALVRQYYGYGTAKARLLVKHGVFPSLRPLAPAGLVAALVVGVLVPQWWGFAAALIIAYGVGLIAAAVAFVPGSLRDRLGVALVAPLMHLPFGMGVWTGLIPSRHSRGRAGERT